MSYYITLLLLAIAGIINASMDTVSTSFNTSIFASLNRKYFDPAESWKNKWRYNPITKAYTEEAFFLSSTSLVFLTDFWHLCKMLMLVLIFTSTVIYVNKFGKIIDIIILYSTFTISFEIANRLFRKQKLL